MAYRLKENWTQIKKKTKHKIYDEKLFKWSIREIDKETSIKQFKKPVKFLYFERGLQVQVNNEFSASEGV